MSTIPCPQYDELLPNEASLMKHLGWREINDALLFNALKTDATPLPTPATPPSPPQTPPEEGGDDCEYRGEVEEVSIGPGEKPFQRLYCRACKIVYVWRRDQVEGVRKRKIVCGNCKARAGEADKKPLREISKVPPAAQESVLDEAQRLISQDRRAEYGPVEESFERVAKMWSVVFNAPVTAKQVALAMAAFKLCRELHKPKRDNAVDGAAYFALAQQIEEAKK